MELETIVGGDLRSTSAVPLVMIVIGETKGHSLMNFEREMFE